MKLINKYNELVANNTKVNRALIYGAVVVQGICSILIISCSYFGGMRKGVEVTEAWYDKGGKELKDYKPEDK